MTIFHINKPPPTISDEGQGYGPLCRPRYESRSLSQSAPRRRQDMSSATNRRSARYTGRGVLTLAFGAPRYISMAKALGRSLELYQPDVKRAIVTDAHDDRELTALFDYVIPCDLSYGTGVRQKLYLDRYSPFERTLFIDSDCLLVRPIDHLWDAFYGKSFTVQGGRTLRRGDQERYLDVDKSLDLFYISEIPKFNGGLYYFERSEEADLFFRRVRQLASRYHDFCRASFRQNGPADEAIYALAMALHGMEMTGFWSGGMIALGKARGPVTVDVGEGIAIFNKYGRQAEPDIVHFNGRWANSLIYQRQRITLYLGQHGMESRLCASRAPKTLIAIWMSLKQIVESCLEKTTARYRLAPIRASRSPLRRGAIR